jgi:hypothetical protein
MKKENRFYVYRHIRLDKNEVFYIGVGKEGTIRAWNFNKRTAIWKNVYNKNEGQIKVEILFHDLTELEADNKEIEFIALYKRKCDGGTLVNYQPGGNNCTGYKLSEEHKKQIGERSKGNKYRIGKKASIETREKISKVMKGDKRNLGKHHSEETKKLMSNRAKNRPNLTTGTIYITDGIHNKRVKDLSLAPEGWVKGRTYKNKFKKKAI